MQKHSLHIITQTQSALFRTISKVFTGVLFARLIGIIAALLIIRNLTVNDYANYTMFNTIFYLLPALIGSGINSSLVRFSAEQISAKGARPFELYVINYFFQLTIYVLLATIIYFYKDTLTSFLFGSNTTNVIIVYGLIAGLGLSLREAGRRVYAAEEKFGKFISTLWLRQTLMLILISLLFLLKRLNFSTAVFVIISVELSVTAVVTLNIFSGLRPGYIYKSIITNSSLVHQFISAAGLLIVYSFILSCFSRLDVFMLSHFSDKAALASYGVAFRFYSFGLLLLGSIHAVLLPKFSQIEMQNHIMQVGFVWIWLKRIGWLIIPIGLAIALLKSVFIWAVGIRYADAYNILSVLSIGIWLSVMFSPLVNILIARKNFSFLVLLACVAFVINFTGNYILIPIYGGLGAALVTIISHMILNLGSTVKILFSDNRNGIHS